MMRSRVAENLLTSEGPGGSVFRRLLPKAVAVLLVINVLRWLGEEQGLYGSTTGLVIIALAATGLIGALLCHFALRLDRDDAGRQQAEEELRRSSRYFDLSRDLVCTAGFDGVFKELNTVWTETLGWSEAELRSRPFVEFVHPDDREPTEREAAGLAQGGVAVSYVNRFATKDGQWRWFDWQAVSIVEEGLIYASARDVTDYKAAEAALKAGERQTRQIIDTAHDAFISMDAHGLITGWNPQAEATFGWSRDEVLGHDLADTIVPEGLREAHRRGIAHFYATGEGPVLGKRLELTALHRDGREFPIELTISALGTDQGYAFNAFLRDISERKRAHEELVLARNQALEASRMKSMFVANVSHEIRTPMNGVLGMTSFLLDTELEDEQREYAETISSSGEALLGVIDDILDFSKIEAGKLELDPTGFDLRDAIEKACGMLAYRAHEKGLELVVAIDPEVPALVHGDASRLRQVITNFVSNAIKFTSEGEVVVRATSSPASDGAALVRLEVSDTGIGIDRVALQRLFQPFSQADGSTTRKYGGTGLGLAISKQLIELMGGTVGAESEPGEGSSFWFEVSLPYSERRVGPLKKERDLAGLRVLVVDDNATNQRVLQRQLSAWQMSCEVAENASHAMELLESAARAGEPYALGLLDLNMPDVDGYELACAIRARPALRGIRLLMLTSSDLRSGAPEEACVDGFLSKPVRRSRLQEEIQAVLADESPAAQRAELRTAEDTGAAGQHPDRVVLVVEDTPVNQTVATRMLEKCGFQARVAENGRQALEALSERSYAAVLMDCQMPELDGYDTTREVRRREQGGPRIPIIAMTASSMEGERERCLAAGMDDYLTKPLRNRTLEDTLARWLAEPAGGDDVLETGTERGSTGADELLDEAVVADLENLEGEVLTEIVSLYFDEAPKQIHRLSDAIGRGEALTVGQTAHTLKGSSRTLGAAKVAHMASELEAAAKAGDLTRAGELLDNLRSELDATRNAFRSRAAFPALAQRDPVSRRMGQSPASDLPTR